MNALVWKAAAILCAGSAVAAAQQMTAAERGRVDAAVQQAMSASQPPSVSVGVARGGQVVYAKAFGSAVLQTPLMPSSAEGMSSHAVRSAVPADAAMAYPIGSISKQFTAACILLLQERGKLRLDDPVSRWFPEFTRAGKVTLRNLLTHTSGYSDYYPQDYTPPGFLKPVDSYTLVKEWATKPLDFDPGTKWEYSNTNYQMAGLIVQKVTGQSFHDFLWSNVIVPLKLQGVLDLDRDQDRLAVRGYQRHALGPLRPAKLEAPGWSTADGSLAMPVATLLRWDESIVHRTLLQPESYDALETDFRLKDGTPTHYGLGVDVQQRGNVRVLMHSGEVGGFVSNNVVDLTDDVSYAALTNFEGSAAEEVTAALRPVLLPALGTRARSSGRPGSAPAPAFDPAPAAQLKGILTGLQQGRLDRSLLTDDLNFYFNGETLSDFTSSLRPLGPVQSVTELRESHRGGMVFRIYRVQFAGRALIADTYTQPDGRLEQLLVRPGD